jgi:hypothetical protein
MTIFGMTPLPFGDLASSRRRKNFLIPAWYPLLRPATLTYAVLLSSTLIRTHEPFWAPLTLHAHGQMYVVYGRLEDLDARP